MLLQKWTLWCRSHLASDGYICWRRQWHPTPVLLPRKSHGWRSRVDCSPWGCEESDTTERIHFHFSLSCIGEGNGNPLQCSCLENPRDGGAWWAAVYVVAQSRTRLKRLSNSSSNLQSRVFGIWFLFHILHQGFFMYLPWNYYSGGKESACSVGDPGSIPGSGYQENPLENGMATTPVFLPGEFHGQSMGLQRLTVIPCNDARVLFTWISIICSTDNNWYETFVSLLIDPFYCHWNSQVFWCCHLWTRPLAISDNYKKNINHHNLIVPRY